MTMDAQRRAQVLEGLYREIRREHEQVAGQRLDTVKEQAQAVYDSIQALKVGGAKPSESSMVQRIEALEGALREIAGFVTRNSQRAFRAHMQALAAQKSVIHDPTPGAGERASITVIQAQARHHEAGRIFSVIERTASAALDGPPDPERDRETRAEVERP